MIWQTLVKPVTDLFGKVIDKVAADKMSETDRERLKLEASQLASAELQKSEDNFRNFIIKYEGEAKDMPRVIQILRGSVRPILTYTLAGFWIWGYVYMFLNTNIPLERTVLLREIMDLLFKLNLVSLGFWYGEKIITRTGLAQFFKRKEQ